MEDRVLAVIPARGGSTRVPGKNTIPICGKPAYQWTVEHLQEMKSPCDIVLVSDDESLLSRAAADGIGVVREPPEWVEAEYDLVAVYGAMLQAEQYLLSAGEHYQAVLIAYPCCPVRPPGIFDLVLQELREYEADVVQTVFRSPIRLHPHRTLRKTRGGDLTPIFPGGEILERTQNLPPTYHMSAAAYALSRPALQRLRFSGVQHCSRFRGVEHGMDEFLDIDGMDDVVRAERILQERGNLT